MYEVLVKTFEIVFIERRISALCKENDMTQRELSDRLRISHQAVSKWKREESIPDTSKLPQLAGVCPGPLCRRRFWFKNK